MLKAVAIDDEPLPLELLQNFCAQTELVSLVASFSNIREAQQYLQRHSVDLLFLDIQMPQLSGIDLYQSLQQKVMVIFTTAHSQYAIDGFNLNAIDYLLKPFSLERFLTAINKAKEYHSLRYPDSQSDKQYLYVRSNYQMHKIPLTEIILIESFADYIDIHLSDKNKITVRMSLKSILDKLPEKDFMRVHRSYVIAINHIEKAHRNTVYIADRAIPIGTNYKEIFQRRF